MSSSEVALAERDRADVKSGARVSHLVLRNFRSHKALEVSLADGVTVIHGPVGAGKTNLLEGLYFGCVGRSPRTHNNRELVRFGERAAHVSVTTSVENLDRTFEVGLELGGSKIFKLDGRSVDRPPIDSRPLLCVFMPDRLELVKGAAAGRRSHLDAFVGTLWPARSAVRLQYARALAQRNALIGRIRAKQAMPGALSGWNRELAYQGMQLLRARRDALALLAPAFTRYGEHLGIEGEPSLTYVPRSRASKVDDLEAELAAGFERDLERGFTTHGPHRDDLRFAADQRDLRRFGSQGQQRLALLALLLSERESLGQLRGKTPMLLLDDVLSELDRSRRDRLLDLLQERGQSLITTADFAAVRVLGMDLVALEVKGGRTTA